MTQLTKKTDEQLLKEIYETCYTAIDFKQFGSDEYLTTAIFKLKQDAWNLLERVKKIN